MTPTRRTRPGERIDHDAALADLRATIRRLDTADPCRRTRVLRQASTLADLFDEWGTDE